MVAPQAELGHSIYGRVGDLAVGYGVVAIPEFHSAMSKLKLEVVGSVKNMASLAHSPQNLTQRSYLKKLLAHCTRHLAGSGNYYIEDVGMLCPYRLLEESEARL